MSLPVHLVDPLADVRVGDVVEVIGAEAHHAVAVRRLRPGEQVQLTDGRGTRATGAVATADRRLLEVQVGSVQHEERPTPTLTVVQAIPKGERGELAIEVLTEIGVDVIVPWAASRSVTVWRAERREKALARWRSTAREAAKQARRSWFPEVLEPVATSGAAQVVEAADLAVVLHESADEALADLDLTDAQRIVLVVGPEGGLTEGEIEELAGHGARSVRLGQEVLRTSTAGVAACAALLSQTPRWRS